MYFLPGRHTLDRKAVSEANFNVAYAPREGYSTLQYPTYKSKGSAYSIHSGTLKSKFDVTQLIHIFNIIFVIIRISIKIQDITNNRWPYNILVLKYRFYCFYLRNTNENTWIKSNGSMILRSLPTHRLGILQCDQIVKFLLWFTK